jgi:hypothetical protein
MRKIKSFHDDLHKAKEKVYDACAFEFSNLQWETESQEYGACTFELHGSKILYRNAKITPTKNGQFVSIWKRNKNGITKPFDIQDKIDFIIITARSGDHFGQFIFPKSVLANKEIITQKGKIGKRGIRIYPPWEIPNSKQAERTQNWQLNYFLTIKEDDSTNLFLAKKLLQLNQ